MITIAIYGICGRMGNAVASLALDDKDIKVVGALERRGHAMLGADVGSLIGRGKIDLPVSYDLSAKADVLLDFTEPSATLDALWSCLEKNMAMVIGTTGHNTEQRAAIEDAADKIPIVMSPNMSVGVNLLFEVVRRTAEILGDKYDVEIVEAHHRFKKDAPSGTARALVETIGDARQLGSPPVVYGREGALEERKRGEIGVHSVRAGDIAGDHTVMFVTNGERLEYTHRAHSRECFARGAIQAAKFVVGKTPAVYSMSDVLGLKY